MRLFCPTCHHDSGNAVTADWPEPLDARKYEALICNECGREFWFQIDHTGMRCGMNARHCELEDFLVKRKRKQLRA